MRAPEHSHADRVRFWAKVQKGEQFAPGACWLWTGGTIRGYGRFMIYRAGRYYHQRPHRISYEHARGPIPDGLTLDHLCKVRNCVAPWHLEPVTATVNAMRGECPPAKNARKTHCAKGHPLSGCNVFRSMRENGAMRRSCMSCMRLWRRANAARYYTDPVKRARLLARNRAWKRRAGTVV